MIAEPTGFRVTSKRLWGDDRGRGEVRAKRLHSLCRLLLHILETASKRHDEPEILLRVILPLHIDDGTFSLGVVMEAAHYEICHSSLRIASIASAGLGNTVRSPPR